MSTPREVIVVGAGMAGLSTAWQLQHDGVHVTVVDKVGVAAGSSWGNAGWLAPALTLPLPDPSILATGVKETLKPSSPVYVPFTANPRLIRFLLGFARHCTPGKWRQAMAVYNQVNSLALGAFEELNAGGVKEPIHDADPFLAAFASDADREAMIAEFRQVAETGGKTDFELLSADEITSQEPSLGDGVSAGLLLRGQRFINPGRFVHSLADSIRSRGGEILDGVTVIDVRDRGSSGVDVHTMSRTLHADAAVVATGTWLGGLVREFGVKTIVQAGRGYSFTVQPEHMPRNPVYFPTQRVACTPLGDGFRIAGMMEFRRAGDPLDRRRIRAIINAVAPMFRGIDWDARTDEWVGSRPCTADGLPIIGATRSPRVFVAGGHGMWGIALGPLSGRLLARQITRGEVHPVMRHFNPLR